MIRREVLIYEDYENEYDFMSARLGSNQERPSEKTNFHSYYK